MPYGKLRVESYSGYTANERPVAFTFRGRRWEVDQIVDRWYEGGLEPGRPQVNYFRVKTAEGTVFLLRYVSLFDAWSVWSEESDSLADKCRGNLRAGIPCELSQDP